MLRYRTAEQLEGNEAIAKIDRGSAAGVDVQALIRTSLDGDKAENVVVIDLAGKTNIADIMIIATGTSQRHVGAMAEHLRERLKTAGVRTSVEGEGFCEWVLIDAGDAIVHLFRPEVRTFYALEKMWGDSAVAYVEGSSTQAGLSA